MLLVAGRLSTVPGFEDFNRWAVEHEIPEEEWPEAFARWLGEQMEDSPVRFEKLESGDEQILPDSEQRDLDSLPSALERGDAD
jgi:hypothetical protein